MKEIKMIGKVQVNGQKRISLVWNFFKKLDETNAKCNYCGTIYNCKSSRSHLFKHLRKKHPEAVVQFRNQDQAQEEKIDFQVLPTDETSLASFPPVEVLLRTDDTESGGKSACEEQSSDIWSLFTRVDDTFAECNLCQIKLSCKYSITDLTIHREIEHSGVLLKCDSSDDDAEKNMDTSSDTLTQNLILTIPDLEESEEETSRQVNEIIKSPSHDQNFNQTSGANGTKQIKTNDPHHEENPLIRTELEQVSMNENLDACQDQDNVSKDSTVTVHEQRGWFRKKASAWKYYIKLHNGCLQCKICGMTLSKKSGAGNLRRHMNRAHSSSTKKKDSAMQMKIADIEVLSPNRWPDSSVEKTRPVSPFIHTFDRNSESISTQSDEITYECHYDKNINCLGDQSDNEIKEKNQITTKSTSTQAGQVLQTAYSNSDLSERLVLAVEESNRLLRSLQNTIERQGEALSRLVASIEGMN